MDINNVMSIKTTLEMAKTNHLEAQIQMCQFRGTTNDKVPVQKKPNL